MESTLEEVFTGFERQVGFKRHVFDYQGQITQEEQTLTALFPAGAKHKHRLHFERAGTQKRPGLAASDVQVVLHILEHPIFTRGDGSESFDLYMKDAIELSLKQALCDCAIDVPGINGETISVELNDVIEPEQTKRLVGHGLVIEDSAGSDRGDLIIKFKIKFPSSIPGQDQAVLKSILPD